MISQGSDSASAKARSVLPEAVGPSSMMAGGSASHWRFARTVGGFTRLSAPA